MNYQHHRSQLGDGDWAFGHNENGEQVIWERGPVGTVKTTTLQDNGWNVIHYWHEDGTLEEMYERQDEYDVLHGGF